MFKCDMLDESSISHLVQMVENQGFDKIDHVVLNAGVLKYPNVR